MKKTPFFPADTKPLSKRPGWYEIRYVGADGAPGDLIAKAWWTGREWRVQPRKWGMRITGPVQFRGLTAPAEAA